MRRNKVQGDILTSWMINITGLFKQKLKIFKARLSFEDDGIGMILIPQKQNCSEWTKS
jgi:hypothetical protein